MVRLPRPTGREMVRFLQGLGFHVVRMHGSHHFLARGEQRTSVPVHGNRALKIGTLHGILRDVGLGPADFSELWQRREL